MSPFERPPPHESPPPTVQIRAPESSKVPARTTGDSSVPSGSVGTTDHVRVPRVVESPRPGRSAPREERGPCPAGRRGRRSGGGPVSSRRLRAVPFTVHGGRLRGNDAHPLDGPRTTPLDAGSRRRGPGGSCPRHGRVGPQAFRDRVPAGDGGRSALAGFARRGAPAQSRPRRPLRCRRPTGDPPHDPSARAGDRVLPAERFPSDRAPRGVLRHGDAPVRPRPHGQETPFAVASPTGNRKQSEEIVQVNVAVP